ncbi:Cytochrome P450 family protein, partial [Metarhizium majus ARSEF 297]
MPFWVALMPLVKDVDQQDVFTKYIEKPLRRHGAASIFFAGQWNVLIHKPAYLAEVFRREDIYQKSGNYSKIPHSVLAALLGDNMISSRGETWNKYKRVIKPGLQASPNLDVLLRNTRQLSTILVELRALPIDGIQGSIQRHTIANFRNTYCNVDPNVGHERQGSHPTSPTIKSAAADDDFPQDMQDRLLDELSLQPEKPPDAEYLDSLPLLTSIYTPGVQAAEDACRVHHLSRRAARMSGGAVCRAAAQGDCVHARDKSPLAT